VLRCLQAALLARLQSDELLAVAAVAVAAVAVAAVAVAAVAVAAVQAELTESAVRLVLLLVLDGQVFLHLLASAVCEAGEVAEAVFRAY
jgi:hypothetical protein